MQHLTLLATMLCVFSLLSIVLFDFEDLLLENQLSVVAKKVADSSAFKQQISGAIPELDTRWYRGYENLPTWIQDSVSIDKLGAAELFNAKDSHYHLLSLQDESGGKYYLVLEASSYLISKDWVIFYLIVIAVGLGVIFLLANWWLAKATDKVSAPLEYLSSALDQEELHELSGVNSDVIEVIKLKEAVVSKSQRIKQLVEREREFNREVSHELRTPLTILTGALEIALQKHPSSTELIRALDAVTDMCQLVEGVLWLGRSVNGSERCQVSQLQTYCKSTFSEKAHAKGLSLSFSTNGDDHWMPVPEPVARVLLGNLLKNAIAYTEEGFLQVNWTSNRCEVIDSGIGFGHPHHTESGFGIGLSLIEKLCNHFSLKFTIIPLEKSGTCCLIQW